jgi:indole-3-glycerol phosphate synthase
MAAHVARRVEKLKREEPVETLRGKSLYARLAQDLTPAFQPGARIVEVRFAGPTEGFLVPREGAVATEAARLCKAAQKDGAAAAAVWVERNFHAGDYAHLEAARAACPDFLLIARDIIVDPWQLERCRAAGADGVELSPDFLGAALPATIAVAKSLGLTPVIWLSDGSPRLA